MQNNEIGILAQKPFLQERKLGLQERKLSLRWLVAISSLPLFGIVAAWAIAKFEFAGKVLNRFVWREFKNSSKRKYLVKCLWPVSYRQRWYK